MATLPRFELARPADVAEATALLAEAGPEARILAGGTDLLVTLRQRVQPPRLVVALDRLDALRGIHVDDCGTLVLGAGETLDAISTSPVVRERAPLLVEACDRIAHPQVRTMGTLGGNVCLDTRCRWVNRDPSWRGALGGCLKDGQAEVCHVVPGGRRCVAAASGDSLAPLYALGAEVDIVGPAGAHRRVPIATLRAKDGARPLALGPGELLAAIRVPAPAPRRRAAYHKWSVRRAVDFPLVSVALVCDLDASGCLDQLRVAVGVLGPRPRVVSRLDAYRGQTLSGTLATDVAATVGRACTPLANVPYDPAYRHRLLEATVARQLTEWASS